MRASISLKTFFNCDRFYIFNSFLIVELNCERIFAIGGFGFYIGCTSLATQLFVPYLTIFKCERWFLQLPNARAHPSKHTSSYVCMYIKT